MSVSNRYLIYRLKKTLSRTLTFTALSSLLSVTSIHSSQLMTQIRFRESGIYILAIVLGLFCTLIPMLELAEFKNRRNLDTLYFFPIDRRSMAIVHFLSGFIQTMLIYTVTFAVSFIYLGINTTYFDLSHMIPYYLFSILLGFVMFSVFMFLFWQANTVADGVLFCFLWMFVISLIIWVINDVILRDFVSAEVYDFVSYLTPWGIIYDPINNLTVIFQDKIEINQVKEPYSIYMVDYAQRYLSQWYMFIVWGAVGIAAAIGYVISFVRKGAQMAGEISDSPFGFKVLIPAYAYSLLALYTSDVGIDLMFVLIIILMVAGYIIYRRGLKFKKSDYIVMAAGILPILLGMIF